MSDLGSIIAHLKLDITNFNNSLNEARTEIENTSADLSGLESVGSSLQAVGAGLTAAITVPVVAFGKSAVEATTTFNASLSKTGALMGATTEDMNKLRDAAKEYGATTQFSASECSDALGYMALAGWNATQSVDALPGVLNLAASSGMELAAASDLVTDYLSAFGMEANQAGQMSDVLAYAQAKSNTTTEALGQAFKNCAANCHAAGMDVQTTTALLGQLANQGLKGSEAGTALSAMMRDMTAKMKDGEIQIGKTKVKVQDANGNYRDMIDILSEVEKATNGMGDAERAAALSSTFTSDSIKGLNLILNAGTGTAEEFRKSLYNCEGTAEDMAEKMNDNLAGDIKSMQSAFESMQIAVGEKLDPILRAFVQTLTKVFSAIGQLPAPVLQVIMVVAGLLAVIGPTILIFGTFMTKLNECRQGLRMLKAAFNLVKNANIASKAVEYLGMALSSVKGIVLNTVIPALQSLWGVLMANPIVLIITVIAALVAGFIYLWNNCEGFRNFWLGLWEDIKSAVSNASIPIQVAFKSLINTFSSIKTLLVDLFGGVKTILSDLFSGNFSKLSQDIKNLGKKLKSDFKNILTNLRMTILNGTMALKDVFSSGLAKLLDPFINWGYSINEYFGDAFVDLFGIMEDTFGLIVDYIRDVLSIILNLFSGDWQGAINGIGKLFSNLWDNLSSIGGDIKSLLINLFKGILTEIKNWISNAINYITQGAINILNTITTFLSQLPYTIAYWLGYALGTLIKWGIELHNTLSQAASSAINSFIEWWTTLPQRLSTWLDTTINNITNWAETTKEQASTTGKAFIDNLINYIKDLPNRVSTWLQNTIQNIINWASNVKSQATQTGINFVNNIISFIQNLPSKLWSILLQTINRVITFASNLKSRGMRAGRDFVNTIVNAIKSLPSKLASIGKDAINGLINGLKSGAGDLWNAATGLARQAFNGMRAALQIKSPSRVFRDKIGKMIPAGVALGIQLNAKEAYKTLASFTDNLIALTPSAQVAANMNTNTGGVVSNNIINTSSTDKAIQEVIELLKANKVDIDYDKMADAFTRGASNVDNTIIMDKEVVGKKVANPVKKANDLVKARLNRLEGVETVE